MFRRKRVGSARCMINASEHAVRQTRCDKHESIQAFETPSPISCCLYMEMETAVEALVAY